MQRAQRILERRTSFHTFLIALDPYASPFVPLPFALCSRLTFMHPRAYFMHLCTDYARLMHIHKDVEE
jgi:hypothetical protein